MVCARATRGCEVEMGRAIARTNLLYTMKSASVSSFPSEAKRADGGCG